MVVKVQVTDPNKANPRKIPSAIFLEKVEDFIVQHTVENIMESLNEVYNKYKVMEMQIQKQRQGMSNKLPEIQKALDCIRLLKQKQENDHKVDYQIADQMWAKATVSKDVEHVSLWLGANTMVEFTLDEAQNLLNRNLKNAKTNIESFEEDLSFLKDQITTCEVNIARVYNTNLRMVEVAKNQTKN